MNIIRQGKKPDPVKRFECKLCGCIFEADKGEYHYVDLGYNQVAFEAYCPCCGAQVWAIDNENAE